MQQPNKKRRWIVVIFFLLLLAGIVLAIVFARETPDKKLYDKGEEESAQTGIVTIDNTVGLNKILLFEQYSVVYQTLDYYIRENISASFTRAEIVGEPVVNRDGTVSFVLKITNPNKQFEVIIERNVFDRIVIKIPSNNYTQTVLVYGSDSIGD